VCGTGNGEEGHAEGRLDPIPLVNVQLNVRVRRSGSCHCASHFQWISLSRPIQLVGGNFQFGMKVRSRRLALDSQFQRDKLKIFKIHLRSFASKLRYHSLCETARNVTGSF
jgi:hypothetical protein